MRDVTHIIRIEGSYPPPTWGYSPSVAYPEYAYKELAQDTNPVYEAVRESFLALEMDKAHLGTAQWSPLSDVISPGDTVLVKPNLVYHANREGLECLTTHPSVLRAVLDYCLLAMKGEGRLIVGDAPVQSCDFDRLLTEGHYLELEEFYRRQGADLRFMDLRGTAVKRAQDGSFAAGARDDARAATGSLVVDIGEHSRFAKMSEEDLLKLRITNYAPGELQKHHSLEKHEYRVSEALLEADVIINLPKPKTHRKAGITGAMKNMVGINTDKAYLPHHRTGSAQEGGDEYAHKNAVKARITRIQEAIDAANARGESGKVRRLYALSALTAQAFKLRRPADSYSEGSWHGNDTIWRTIADLQFILQHVDKTGQVNMGVQRRQLILADMIVAGQGEGPLEPSPAPLGRLILGRDPAVIDALICRLFGVSEETIPSVAHATSADTAKAEVLEDGAFTKLGDYPVSSEKVRFSSGWEDR